MGRECTRLHANRDVLIHEFLPIGAGADYSDWRYRRGRSSFGGIGWLAGSVR